MQYTEIIVKLLVQLFLILISCKFISYLGRRYFRQTNVVCEMIAGVLLGPSFLGLLLPGFQDWLFPTKPLLLGDGSFSPNPSMAILYAISQIGLVLYMFLVGLEFNTTIIKKNFKTSGFISLAGMICPFSLGMLSIYLAPKSLHLFADPFPLFDKAFFLGICLSITAFPMLARILEENKISTTKFGTISLAAGSLDDLMAWLSLSLLLSLLKKDFFIACFAVLGTLLYILFLQFIRSKIEIFFKHFKKNSNFEKSIFSVVLIFLIGCALITEKIGIYLIFGSFLAGIALPRNEWTQEIRNKIHDLTSSLLLPTFFVFSGLNTRITSLNSGELWAVTAMILVVAILGKGGGCVLAAKYTGQTWRDSLMIGALMNSRGLMELIAINIGLQQNFITYELYTILVLMAVITTLMASPTYYYIQRNMPT